MTTGLVTILGESTFVEQIDEIAQFAAQAQQAGTESDESRAALHAKAEQAEEDAEKRKAVVKEAIFLLKGLGSADVNAVNDREIEGVYNLASSLIASNFGEDDEEAKDLWQSLSSALTSGDNTTNERAIIRYRVLSNIFNSLPETSANRCLIFKALFESASANDDLDLIADALSSIPNWLAEWNVKPAEKAQLLQQIAKELESAGEVKQAYSFLLLHLRFLASSTMSGQGSASETKAAAERTIATALSLSSIFEFEELSEISTVKDIASEPVGQLLHIFSRGQTKDYKQWVQANGAELKRLGLSDSHLERKIRLLDLASLCSQSVSRTVPYAEIAKVLEIDISEVEVWVIDVIRVGLVSGKLSQISQSLRVYKSVYRTFGEEQWRLLESRLSTWDQSIASILQTLAESRQSGSFTQGVSIPGADAAVKQQAPAQQSSIAA